MLKLTSSLSLIFIVATSWALASGSASAAVSPTETGRVCIPTADMLSMTAAISKSSLQAPGGVGVILDVKLGASGNYLIQNTALGIAANIPNYVLPKRPTFCQPDTMFDQAHSISAAYILAFGDVLSFRKSYKWPIQGANLAAPASITILANYGKYVLVLLNDNAFRMDASGNMIFDCGGAESYRVNPATGLVLPFNSCVEFGGVRALPRLSQLPD
jgi:hypothetical protein